MKRSENPQTGYFFKNEMAYGKKSGLLEKLTCPVDILTRSSVIESQHYGKNLNYFIYTSSSIPNNFFVDYLPYMQ